MRKAFQLTLISRNLYFGRKNFFKVFLEYESKLEWSAMIQILPQRNEENVVIGKI